MSAGIDGSSQQQPLLQNEVSQPLSGLPLKILKRYLQNNDNKGLTCLLFFSSYNLPDYFPCNQINLTSTLH